MCFHGSRNLTRDLCPRWPGGGDEVCGPWEPEGRDPLTFVKSGFGVSCSGVQSGWETGEEVWGGDDDARAKCLLGSPRIGAWSFLWIRL